MYKIDLKEIEKDVSIHKLGCDDPCFERVYLIDDSTIDNFVHLRMLTHTSFSDEVFVYTQTTLALNFLKEIASDKMKNSVPSVIFLDLNMPTMTGDDFVKEFSKLPKFIRNNCKIVILSNYLSSAKTELYKNKYDCVVTCLNKPLLKKNLLHIIHLLKVGS